jgi:hypothetical protein
VLQGDVVRGSCWHRPSQANRIANPNRGKI